MVTKNILAICGSASANSTNLSILKWICNSEKTHFNVDIIDDLSILPHFRTEFTDDNTPREIIDLRTRITNADGVIICTPEYVFSIPSGLKNMIEWCVSTTVFSDKPTGIITASASGKRAHEELLLIMKTLQARLTDETTLLIQGVKGKIDKAGIIHAHTETQLRDFAQSLSKHI